MGLGLAACKDDAGAGECVSLEDYFTEEVWTPILSQKCITCHNPQGEARHSEFVLQSSDWPGYLEANLATVESLAKLQYEGRSWLLVKPTNGDGVEGIEHGGQVQIEPGSEEYEALAELVERIENPVECEDDESEEGDFFADVTMLDEVETLRKASLSIVGRLPTPEEEQRARVESWAGVDAVLDEMMREPAFKNFIKELYNDLVLTERYNRDTAALELLDEEDYPNAFWYLDVQDEAEQNLVRTLSNRAVAQEVLELVAHVVTEDRPFTEILTADYVMVNPYSAQSYGASVSFDDQDDPEEWKEADLGLPHAGILSSHVWLNRFPTTDTNRNRHRSRMVYKFFLNTDILRLAERPIDPTNIEDFNPTMFNAACSVCHAVVDPVAGAFQNWDIEGRYRLPEGGWYTDMRQPGFGEAVIPAGRRAESLQWLAEIITADNRFNTSTVAIVYKGLTGADPLFEPNDPAAADYLGKLRAFEVQNDIFEQVGTAFVEGDHNIKIVFKEIIKSPLYRAKNISADLEELPEERAYELQALGTARFLTPEGLNRKIYATTGYPWRDDADDQDYLLDQNWYRIFYGGIDSDSVTERITDPNGIMWNIASRMGNEMACATTARDFVREPATRVLFPYVDPSFEPEDVNGFEVPAVAESIRRNIQYLHERLFGEFVELDSPEVDRTYALFLEVWRDGKRGLAEGEYDNNLPGDCRATRDFWTGMDYPAEQQISADNNYTIRAWMAVMTYMLSDYRFLHE